MAQSQLPVVMVLRLKAGVGRVVERRQAVVARGGKLMESNDGSNAGRKAQPGMPAKGRWTFPRDTLRLWMLLLLFRFGWDVWEPSPLCTPLPARVTTVTLFFDGLVLAALPLLLLYLDLRTGRITARGFVLWAGMILAGLTLYELVRNPCLLPWW